MKNKANINVSALRLPVLAVGLLLFMFIVSLLMGSKTFFAAQSEKELEEITTLEKDKVYDYDLNSDGKPEKIQYKLTLDDEKFTVTLKLYINDKLCMSRKDHGFSYTLQLVDLDKSDNYLDLYGYGTMESDCISYSFFARYDENNQYHATKFSPKELTNNFISTRYSLGALDGDGKFDLMIDTPIFSEAIGCYICYVPFQLKDNVISCVPAKTYAFNKFSKEYQYKAAKSFSVYATVGSKKVAYTVKKGEMVTFHSLYVTKSGKAYFRIVNTKGTTGWIKSTQENLFIEYPAWG